MIPLEGLIRLVSPDNPDSAIFPEAAEIIRQGGVVAFPTDTFYGLAVNPFDANAVARLFKIKERSPSKPILLLIAGIKMLDLLVEPPSPLARKVMEKFWPGPLTIILKAKKRLPDALTAGTGKIGIRFPNAALPIRLICAAGFPLTATSANLSGKPSPATAHKVLAQFGTDLDLILDGGKCKTLPSTVLDMTPSEPTVLRAGKVPTNLIKEFLHDFS